MALVYALFDVANPTEMRYIGKTTWTAQKRLKRHLSNARYDASQEPVYRWIRKHVTAGDVIDVAIIEDELTEEAANQREIYYIDYYKSLDHRLINVRSGGEGGAGQTHSEETKRAIGIESARHNLARRMLHLSTCSDLRKTHTDACQVRQPKSTKAKTIKVKTIKAKTIKVKTIKAKTIKSKSAVAIRKDSQLFHLSSDIQAAYLALPESASKREKIQAKYWLRRAESMI